MLPILLSLLASLAFGISIVVIQRGCLTLDVFRGLLVNLFVNSALLWIFLSLFVEIPDPWITTNLIFVLAGLLVPGLSRYFIFHGIERLGASVSSCLANATPLFAILIAILFLGERPAVTNFLGAIFIVGGIICLSWRGETKTWRTKDLLFPLIGAFLFAVRDNLVRFALLITHSPILGAAIASTTSAVAMGAVYLVMPGARFPRADRSGLVYFAFSGLLHFLAYLLMFTALNLDRVSIVSPLVNCSSLFTVFLAYFFLRDVDKISARKIWTVALVILGVFLISWEKL